MIAQMSTTCFSSHADKINNHDPTGSTRSPQRERLTSQCFQVRDRILDSCAVNRDDQRERITLILRSYRELRPPPEPDSYKETKLSSYPPNLLKI